MLKFLRKFRKKFRTACLTATLATCWQVGEAAKADTPNWGDDITIKFSGTVSPTVKDISHLFLVYGTGYSFINFGPWNIKLGDFPAGQSISFSVQGPASYDSDLFWIVAGLYGDISSGRYIEGVNGVTLGLEPGSTIDGWIWDWKLTEQDAFDYLLNDSPGNAFLISAMREEVGLELTNTSNLFNFSGLTYNGQIQIQTEIVPEPVSIILFGTGGLIVTRLRRRT